MNIEIELPPDVKARYAAGASAKGVSVERHIIDYLIYTAYIKNERSRAAKAEVRRLRLPQLRGTIIGSLRRREIHGDRSVHSS